MNHQLLASIAAIQMRNMIDDLGDDFPQLEPRRRVDFLRAAVPDSVACLYAELSREIQNRRSIHVAWALLRWLALFASGCPCFKG